MTTDNKTLAVDVLAVMAREAKLARHYRIENGAVKLAEEASADASAARDAVAELIDVASRFDSYKSSDFGDTSILDNEDLWNRLSAALARVKGESA